MSIPLLACGDIIKSPFEFSNETDIRLVALIMRGNCSFGHKVAVAQVSGYSGAIIYNNINGPTLNMANGKDFFP